ncbi:MAG: hypothetical protein LBU84_08700 [Prevotella sp.]|jgi:hypothetical protein|nr:hypothetical protein [Prevotella sp.]
MKKTVLFLFLFFSFLFYANSQNIKKIIQIETDISEYSNKSTSPDTITYNFENGKLLSKIKSNGSVSKYIYNDNGLLSRISTSNTKYPEGDDVIEDFEYDKNGFLVRNYRYHAKNGILNDKVNTTDIRYEHNLKNDNEFIIIGKGTCTNTSKANCIDLKFEMKNNILTETRIVYSQKTVSVYTFKDRNLYSVNKNKNTNENHTLVYTYDNSKSVNSIIFENLFGKKYRQILLYYSPDIHVNNQPKISENNLKSSIIEKQTKRPLGIITDNVIIKYNSDNMPTKAVNNQIVYTGSEKSPRALIEETYFYE